MAEVTIERRPAATECARLLAALPDWFALPDANRAYAEAAGGDSTWVARDGDAVVGVLTLIRHTPDAIENALLAVAPTHHRRGIGRMLLDIAEGEARGTGTRYLTVKTLGPSNAWEPYARTRAFYRACGFVALEEFSTLWDAGNPCLFMVRPVAGVMAA